MASGMPDNVTCCPALLLDLVTVNTPIISRMTPIIELKGNRSPPTKARIAVTTANPEPIGDTIDKVPFSNARYNNKVPIKLMTLIPAIPSHAMIEIELLSMCGDCVSMNTHSKSEAIN